MYKAKLPCPNEKKQRVMEMVLEQVGGDDNVVRIDRTDGVKLFLKNGWVLLRPSGTEPMFRVYAEAKSQTQAEHLASTYVCRIESLLKRIE
jgi:phosphomannomutase/phosphoglucomutase